MKAVLFERKNNEAKLAAVMDVMHYSTAIEMLRNNIAKLPNQSIKKSTFTDKDSISSIISVSGIEEYFTKSLSAENFRTIKSWTLAAITGTVRSIGKCDEFCVIVLSNAANDTNIAQKIEKLMSK